MKSFLTGLGKDGVVLRRTDTSCGFSSVQRCWQSDRAREVIVDGDAQRMEGERLLDISISEGDGSDRGIVWHKGSAQRPAIGTTHREQNLTKIKKRTKALSA